MEPKAPPVVVPSAHTTQLAFYPGGGNQASAFARKYALQNPEWRLDEDEEEVDWSKCHGLVIDASYSALPNLGPIAAAAPMFTRLTVLCLRESGVVDIELLQPCSNLVHLDLSSNEIVHLGGGDFWASFRDLLVLLLHGNKVLEWRAVGGLGKAPKLTYLTLFFNPVCKRNMYRQFTTNCCGCLRGLDLHAVSDEEVVEGSKYLESSCWRACSSMLALPQPLFKGLTEVVSFTPTEQQEQGAKLGNQPTQSTAEAHLVGGGHRPRSAPNCDDLILASVMRRVQLLRTFHARNSPVIIGQRQIRRFLVKRFSYGAAVKIQTLVRKWLVELRSVVALKDILRETGELYLVQEMMTPIQLRSLAWFQRRIAGHFRLKVLITCAKTLERFMGKVAKKFSAFVDSVERAQVGGVVVGQDQSGELAAAVAKALVVTTPGLTWVEAAERTATLVTIVPDCRRLRQPSYIEMPDWPILEQDADTDGIFVTRSVAGTGARTEPMGTGSSTAELTRDAQPRPLSGLRDPRPLSRVRHRAGVFGSQRMRECKISRRRTCARRISRDAAIPEGRSSFATRVDVHEQLWVFRPLKARMLARVLCTLRNESARRPPVPFILEGHLMRCASATRIQAAWRGHVLRWVMLDTLASCMIVERAGVCIQRWWRYQRGLSARLGQCRRLWTLASAVSSPTMYIELDVYFTLTRGWHWENDKHTHPFTFQDGDKVAVVRNCGEPPNRTPELEVNGRSRQGENISNVAARSENRPSAREIPMWVLRSVVGRVPPSEVRQRSALNQVGALLTAGVKAKKVVWPLGVAAVSAAEPAEEGHVRGVVINPTAGQLDRNNEILSESASTDIRLTSGDSQKDVYHTHAFRVHQHTDPAETGPPVNLGKKYGGGVELLELTFSSVQEARARAVLLAISTAEPGLCPNRPIAQLMTLGMLRRAAAGEPGQAVPVLTAPDQGFRRGDAVELSVLRLSEGRGGAWLPAIVHGKIGHGSIYNVILEDGTVEYDVPESSIRPRDCTGKEPALVEMSHLPSRWQRHARSLFTPADRLELELLRQSLPTTTSAEPSLSESPMQLLTNNPRQEADACISQLDGLDGQRLVPVEPRPVSPSNPLGRPDVHMKGCPSPPRWASSQTMSAARAAGGLAAKALEKVARAAAAADEAASPSTWVPGNRFRVGLEKLVHLTAHRAQDAAEKAELSGRRDNATRARHAEHAEPSPRERLEKLKAAEAAIFRHESDEINDRAAFERAIRDHELKASAMEAREYARDNRRLAAEALEVNLANQMVDTKKRESNVERERRRSLRKRQSDVESAKARVAQRQEVRAKQALRVEESNAFTTSASQLARHVNKHAAVLSKAQNARGVRRWVKDQKAHKEDMHRRMLSRVQKLQEQKRNEGAKLRKTLAARGRARNTMDEAVIRHRLGEATPYGDNLVGDVMHVLRPRSRLQVQGASSSAQDGGSCGPFCGEDGGNDGERVGVSNMQGHSLSQRPIETGNVMEQQRRPSSQGIRGGTIPSKPDAPRLRSREQRNRSLYASDAGKTVVVLASVPTVSKEARSKGGQLQGTAGAALLGSKSSQSMIHPASRDAGATPKVRTNPSLVPWPLGRRCW